MNIKNTFLEPAPWLGSSAQWGDLCGSQKKALGFQAVRAWLELRRIGGWKVAATVPVTVNPVSHGQSPRVASREFCRDVCLQPFGALVQS